jgi:hypothetical protein
MEKSRYQNAGKNRHIKIGNRSLNNIVLLKYLGTAARNQNLIQEKIKSLVKLAKIQCRTFCLLAA